jgi:hypothetical protein
LLASANATAIAAAARASGVLAATILGEEALVAVDCCDRRDHDTGRRARGQRRHQPDGEEEPPAVSARPRSQACGRPGKKPSDSRNLALPAKPATGQAEELLGAVGVEDAADGEAEEHRVDVRSSSFNELIGSGLVPASRWE